MFRDPRICIQDFLGLGIGVLASLGWDVGLSTEDAACQDFVQEFDLEKR